MRLSHHAAPVSASASNRTTTQRTDPVVAGCVPDAISSRHQPQTRWGRDGRRRTLVMARSHRLGGNRRLGPTWCQRRQTTRRRRGVSGSPLRPHPEHMPMVRHLYSYSNAPEVDVRVFPVKYESPPSSGHVAPARLSRRRAVRRCRPPVWGPHRPQNFASRKESHPTGPVGSDPRKKRPRARHGSGATGRRLGVHSFARDRDGLGRGVRTRY